MSRRSLPAAIQRLDQLRLSRARSTSTMSRRLNQHGHCSTSSRLRPVILGGVEHMMASAGARRLSSDAAKNNEAQDNDDCPEWQNPLHHKNPKFSKVFAEDFQPGEEMPIVPLPPFSSDENDDTVPAPPHIHELANQIVHLNMLELKELMDKIGDRFGFHEDDYNGSYSQEDDDAVAAKEAAPVVEEKVIFDLKLVGFDAKAKIKVIKEIRGVTSLGLKEAKELVESAPTVIKKGIKKEEAEELKSKLEEAGATIEIA